MHSFARRGVHSYGIGPLTDVEDGSLGYGAHSDQEYLLETELHRFVKCPGMRWWVWPHQFVNEPSGLRIIGIAV